MFASTPASFIIMIITIAVSLLCFYNKSVLNTFLFSPYQVVHSNKKYKIITSGFIHSGYTHLLFNMFTFYFFAFNLEMLIGTSNFLIIYIGSLLLAHIPSLLKHKDDPNYLSLGASGAISGILYSAILMNPYSSLGILFIPFPIPAPIFAILYLAYSIYASKMADNGKNVGNIGHDAHIAGAITGVILTMIVVGRLVVEIWSDYLKYILNLF
jgi:membrane associated rhomboid family serine protease